MKGTHNSLTYARPTKWWMRLLTPIFRCQSKNIDAQLDAGAEAFDIRIVRHRNADGIYCWRGAHGLVTLDVDPLKVIERICSRRVKPYIRIVLERGNADDARRFACLCETLEVVHPDVVFFGGVLKNGWKRQYEFERHPLEARRAEALLIQHVGAMSKSWWGRILPRLWARRNRRNIPWQAESTRNHPIVFLDFI